MESDMALASDTSDFIVIIIDVKGTSVPHLRISHVCQLVLYIIGGSLWLGQQRSSRVHENRQI
jgi:hypothetical protein